MDTILLNKLPSCIVSYRVNDSLGHWDPLIGQEVPILGQCSWRLCWADGLMGNVYSTGKEKCP